MTSKLKPALAALLWQLLVLQPREGLLLRAIHHFVERLVVEIAQPMLGKHEMVARIHIAVILHHARMAAFLGQRADTRRHAHPVGQSGIEKLNEIVAHIMVHPRIEQLAKKVPPLLRRNREIGRRAAHLCASCQREAVVTRHHALHHGRELDVVAADGFKKIVESQRFFGIEMVDHGQRVPFHPMLVEQTNAAHHLPKRGSPGSRAPIGIVEILPAIDGYAHQKVIFFEKLAPFIGQQRAIGLNGIVDLSPLRITLLQRQRPPIKRDGAHQRLAAMPGEKDLRRELRLDILLDEALEQRVAHHVVRGLGIKAALF